MAKFKDSTGQEWDLSLSTGMLGKLRTEAQFVLSRANAARELTEMVEDPMKFGAVLWVLCERQAIDRKIEPEAFAYLLDGDTIELATNALIEAAIDFFQRAGTRAAVKAKLPALMARADEEAKAAAEKAIEEALRTPVGSLPASSASTQPIAPSGS